MNIKELKLLSAKELCVWCSQVTAKELKCIFKANNIKGYSKLKKVQLLDNVLDSIECIDSVEKVEAEIVVEADNKNGLENIVKDSIESDFDVVNMFKDNIKLDQRGDALVQAFIPQDKVKLKAKSKEEYVRRAVDRNNAKFKQIDKDVDKVKNSKKTVNRLNNIFSSLNSGLKAKLDIQYDNDSKNINHNIFIYAHNILIEENLDYNDIYIPILDEYISRDNKKDDREWLDDIQEDGKSLREEYYNNKEVIYIIGDDDDITEVPLDVQTEDVSSILEYKIELFNSPLTHVEMSMSDYYDIYDTTKNGLIYYSLTTEELLSVNRFKKGQETPLNWITYNAVLDLEEKTKTALKANNNIIKELN